jgi:8-amino-7-oxononanoate synthase
MDGDLAPLEDIIALCKKYNAMLVVDEAHATGVFGEKGKGLTHAHHFENMISVHTCGKALGVAGALVCGGRTIIETLINKARSFIYSTAPMPLQAILVSKALELCEAADEQRARLFQLCAMAQNIFPSLPSPSPIIPYILGDEQRALAAAAMLQAKGFDIRAIRPPTVPNNSSRLRITLNALLRDQDMMALASALKEISKETP